MIHNDIQNQLALLVKTSAPPLIEVADSPVESPQWVPGQRLPAHVIASLPSGRFQVQIENQMLDMNLPRNTQPGDTLELTYISPAPRMTFALAPALEQALPQPPNTGVTISDTARFLGALLQRGAAQAAQQQELPAQPGTVAQGPQNRVATAELNKTAVVVPGAPPPVKEFAQALRSAVSQSGLFYESHQAQWVSGERTLASLLQEPQSHLPVLVSRSPPAALPQAGQPMAAGPAGSPLPGAAQNAAPANAASPAPAMPTFAAQQAAISSAIANPSHAAAQPPARPGGSLPDGSERDFGLRAAGAAAAQSASISPDPVHPLAQPLVQQQLDTLENHQIVWQGQVWPGQQMHWEIDEEGANANDQEADQAPRWRTRLHLEMPGLGGVTANILLDGQGLHVNFVADKETTVSRMRGDVAALSASMEAAGLRVAELQVNPDVATV